MTVVSASRSPWQDAQCQFMYVMVVRCVKHWVTVIGVGVFAPVAGVRVLPVGRTPRHYVQSGIEKFHACEGEGPQALFFWHKVRGTTAAITVPCALRITSTCIDVFISSSAGWSMNRSKVRVRPLFVLNLSIWISEDWQVIVYSFNLTSSGNVYHFTRVRK
jgi:hypothetical protein